MATVGMKSTGGAAGGAEATGGGGGALDSSCCCAGAPRPRPGEAAGPGRLGERRGDPCLTLPGVATSEDEGDDSGGEEAGACRLSLCGDRAGLAAALPPPPPCSDIKRDGVASECGADRQAATRRPGQGEGKRKNEAGRRVFFVCLFFFFAFTHPTHTPAHSRLEVKPLPTATAGAHTAHPAPKDTHT
jgi:hypothetical protein